MSAKPTYGVEYVFYVVLVPRTGTADDEFVAGGDLVDGDVKILRGDAAPANLATTPVLDADATKRWKITITSTEMTEASGKVGLLFSDASGAQWKDMYFHFDLDMLGAEPAQGAPPASATRDEKIDWLYAAFRNKKTNDGSFNHLYADDETTVLSKAPVSESGGTTTVGEMVSGA
ncbi:MAG: hypothetical protein AB7T38_02490 [Nitrospirales bacterium]